MGPIFLPGSPTPTGAKDFRMGLFDTIQIGPASGGPGGSMSPAPGQPPFGTPPSVPPVNVFAPIQGGGGSAGGGFGGGSAVAAMGPMLTGGPALRGDVTRVGTGLVDGVIGGVSVSSVVPVSVVEAARVVQGDMTSVTGGAKPGQVGLRPRTMATQTSVVAQESRAVYGDVTRALGGFDPLLVGGALASGPATSLPPAVPLGMTVIVPPWVKWGGRATGVGVLLWGAYEAYDYWRSGPVSSGKISIYYNRRCRPRVQIEKVRSYIERVTGVPTYVSPVDGEPEDLGFDRENHTAAIYLDCEPSRQAGAVAGGHGLRGTYPYATVEVPQGAENLELEGKITKEQVQTLVNNTAIHEVLHALTTGYVDEHVEDTVMERAQGGETLREDPVIDLRTVQAVRDALNVRL